MHNPTIAFIASALLATIPTALGHGNIVVPPAAWPDFGLPLNNFGQEIKSSVFGPVDRGVYGFSGEGNARFFADKFGNSTYKSLREFIMANQYLTQKTATPECGLTIKDEKKRQVLPSVIQYSALIHDGPCEIWCDDTKLLYVDNCRTKYPVPEKPTWSTDYPTAKIPIDASKCKGADRLQFFWLALQEPWQEFTNCVYLKDGTANSTTSATTTPKAGGSDYATPASVPQPGNPAPAPQPGNPSQGTPNPAPAPQPNPAAAPQPGNPSPAAPQPATAVDAQNKKCNPKY